MRMVHARVWLLVVGYHAVGAELRMVAYEGYTRRAN